jgi:DNA repair exonuclease SbcCD ATPase subunit
MKISAKNICRFNDFDVELNGITVIAGVNGCGKTTIGKTLYAATKCESFLLQNLIQQKIKIIDELINSLGIQLYMANVLDPKERKNRKNDPMSIKITELRGILDKSTNHGIDEFNLMIKETKALLQDPKFQKISTRLFPPPNPDTYFEEAIALLNNPLTSEITDYNRKLIEYVFKSEFGEQLANINYKNKPSEISIKIDNMISEIKISENKCTSFAFRQGEKTVKNLIYIDDIYMLEKNNRRHTSKIERSYTIFKTAKNNYEDQNESPYSFESDHSEDMSSILELTKKLEKRNIVHEMSTDKFLAPIAKKISNLIHGEITYSEDANAYTFTQNGFEYLLRNSCF